MAGRDAKAPKERLLEAVLDYVEEHGTHDLRLRRVAAAVGTSHRMLLYHFGSRDGLLVAVTRAVEERQREALQQLVLTPGASPVDVMWLMHRRLTDPALWPQERLFFDLYARALQGHSEARPVLDGVVEDWLGPVGRLFERLGFAEEDALAEARLALAVARGLLLDLLATGDRTAADRTMGRFIARYTALAGAGEPLDAEVAVRRGGRAS
jgi:AcrR family transcriptional regulator